MPLRPSLFLRAGSPCPMLFWKGGQYTPNRGLTGNQKHSVWRDYTITPSNKEILSKSTKLLRS
jgi:hypothetical protein